MTGKVAEFPVHGIDNVPVDFYTQDGLLTKSQRSKDVAAAARADRQYVRVRPEIMRHVGDVVFQVLDLVQVAIKRGQNCACGGIDMQAQLSRLEIGRKRGTETPPLGSPQFIRVAVNLDT